MRDRPGVTRRECLAAAGVGLALLPLWPAGAGTAAPPESERERWRRLLRSPQSAAVVGREYLRSFPREGRADGLAAELAVAVGRRDRGIHDLSDAELGRRLRQGIRRDFELENTVRLRGWVLSRTEARLCALFAVG